MTKTKFRDLSGWLKVAVISAWVLAGYFAFWFLVGFIEGLYLY